MRLLFLLGFFIHFFSPRFTTVRRPNEWAAHIASSISVGRSPKAKNLSFQRTTSTITKRQWYTPHWRSRLYSDCSMSAAVDGSRITYWLSPPYT